MQARSKELELAIRIAVAAHKGQSDKAGLPYILHPLAVMNAVETIDEKIVAVLHDAVEDSEELSIDGIRFDTRTYIVDSISKRCVDAILLLTKTDGVTYNDYINRVCENRLAAVVKKADIAHNLSRLHNLKPEDRTRLAKKYTSAMELLQKVLK